MGRLLDDVRELAEALGGVEERLAAAAAAHATLEASMASVQHAVDGHSAAAGQLAAEVEALRQHMASRAADQDQMAARVQSTADAVSALTVSKRALSAHAPFCVTPVRMIGAHIVKCKWRTPVTWVAVVDRRQGSRPCEGGRQVVVRTWRACQSVAHTAEQL